MQSHNGDVELSVTLDTKGLKSDSQKIKNTIQKELSGIGNEIAKEFEGATDAIEKLGKTAELTVDDIKAKFEGAGWTIAKMQEAIYIAAGGFGALSVAATLALYKIMSDTGFTVKYIQDAFGSIQLANDWQNALADLRGRIEIEPEVIIDDVQADEALEESHPVVEPRVFVEPEAINEAFGDAGNPTIKLTNEDIFIDPDAMSTALGEAVTTLKFDRSNIEIDKEELQAVLDNNSPVLKISDAVLAPETAVSIPTAIAKAIDNSTDIEDSLLEKAKKLQTMITTTFSNVDLDADSLGQTLEDSEEAIKRIRELDDPLAKRILLWQDELQQVLSQLSESEYLEYSKWASNFGKVSDEQKERWEQEILDSFSEVKENVESKINQKPIEINPSLESSTKDLKAEAQKWVDEWRDLAKKAGVDESTPKYQAFEPLRDELWSTFRNASKEFRDQVAELQPSFKYLLVEDISEITESTIEEVESAVEEVEKSFDTPLEKLKEYWRQKIKADFGDAEPVEVDGSDIIDLEWQLSDADKEELIDFKNSLIEELSKPIDTTIPTNTKIEDDEKAATPPKKETKKEAEAEAEEWNNTAKAITRAQLEIARYEDAIKDTHDKAIDLATDLDAFNRGFQYSEDFKNAAKDVAILQKELDTVLEQQYKMQVLGESDEGNEKFTDLTLKAQKLIDKISEINTDINIMRRNFSAYTPGINEEEMAHVQKMYDTLTDKAALLNSKTRELKLLTGSDLIGAVKHGLDNTKKRISKLFSFVKSGLKSIGKGLGNLIKPLRDIRKNAGSAFNFKNLLKYALGIGSLMVLFNKLRSAITEGMRNLARWQDGNNQTNKNISLLMTSLLQLKNALATAFDPILNVITPALNKLIELLIEASNALSQFFAKLTGQSFWMKAIRVQQDYAKSLKGTTGAAQGALAAFDDLDVLNKNGGGGGDAATDPNNMFEEMPIDTISDQVGDWVKKIKIAWEMADFTDIGAAIGEWLKNALESIPWETIKEWAAKFAKSLATLINGFLETEGLGYTIGKTIAEAINTAFTFLYNFVDTLHWDSLGKFIGEALLGIVDWIDTELIGKTLGTALRGIITTAFNALQTFIEGEGFTKLGDKIGIGIQTAIERMLEVSEDTGMTGFEEAGWSIANLANGLFQVIQGALDKVSWIDLAKGLAAGLNTMIEEMDAESIGATLHNLLQTAFDFVNALLDETDLKELVNKIGEIFKEMNLEGFVNDIAHTFFKLLTAGLAVAGKLLAANPKLTFIIANALIVMGIADVGIRIGAVIAEAMLKEWAKKLIETGEMQAVLANAGKVGGKIGAGVIGGIVAAIAGFNLGKLLGEMIFSEDKKEYQNFNWGHFWEQFLGPAETSLKEKITYMAQNISEIMIGVISTLLESNLGPFVLLFEGAINGMIDGLSLIFPQLAEVEINVGDFFFTILTKAKAFVKDILRQIHELLTSSDPILVKIKNLYIGIFEAIKDGVKAPINGIISMVESMVNKIIDGINWLIDKLNEFIDDFDFENPFTGEHYTLDWHLDTLDKIQIPRLAQGAVIPPNSEFLAMLGDQKHGTNIEAPLDTIKEAFAEVVDNMSVGSSTPTSMELDGQVFARLITPYVVSELGRRGYKVSVLEG